MASRKGVKLSAKWQLDASLLSRPVDLTPLVALSRNHPETFIEDDTLHRLVSILLNEQNLTKSDKDTKLDVLNILANVAGGSKAAVSEVRVALQGISEWFDEYIATEEADPAQEPELHKAMVLLLARCWHYKLKTEDVLELTQGNRRIALCTVVGLLEDGETYSTELKQRQRPAQGQMAQWEHELVCQRYEKPLLLQICRLLRGFTHPGTYFEASGDEIALYSVEQFAEEMNSLLDITLRSRLVEKLSVAMYDCLFDEEDENTPLELDESDHMAVTSVHAFLQNLYFYATQNNEEFRRHMLMDTLLIPRLILPYLDRCVNHAYRLYEDCDNEGSSHNNSSSSRNNSSSTGTTAAAASGNEQIPALVKGMAASLRTLVISTFRAPATQFVMTLMRRLNPTARYDYIFSLLCLLNVNMGALDLSRTLAQENSVVEAYHAHSLLHELATVFSKLDKTAQTRVYKRVLTSGAIPISRDTPSYVAVMSVLHGGAAGQLDYVNTPRSDAKDVEEEDHWDIRAEAKRAHAERMANLRQSTLANKESEDKDSSAASASGNGSSSSNGSGYPSAFETAVAVAKLHEDMSADKKKDLKSESKSSKGSSKDSSGQSRSEDKKKSSYTLLGDLPSLNKRNNAQEIRVAISLELPGEATKPVPRMMVGGREVEHHVSDPSIPKEFLCAINGHVMKEPVQAITSGLVFERATIELWLSTRGSVCPITCQPLMLNQLEPANDLRSRIMRYHIQQTSMRVANNNDDDLYDF